MAVIGPGFFNSVCLLTSLQGAILTGSLLSVCLRSKEVDSPRGTFFQICAFLSGTKQRNDVVCHLNNCWKEFFFT